MYSVILCGPQPRIERERGEQDSPQQDPTLSRPVFETASTKGSEMIGHDKRKDKITKKGAEIVITPEMISVGHGADHPEPINKSIAMSKVPVVRRHRIPIAVDRFC